MKVQKIRINVWSATCKVKVQQFSAAGDELEDAAVGDVPAASHLEVLQGGAVLAEQSQSSISQPEEEIDGCNRAASECTFCWCRNTHARVQH